MPTPNYHFRRLQLVVETFGHSTKRIYESKLAIVPKIVKPTNKILSLSYFEDHSNKQSIVPSLFDGINTAIFKLLDTIL